MFRANRYRFYNKKYCMIYGTYVCHPIWVQKLQTGCIGLDDRNI